jgi:type III restriction enzyme
LADTPIENPILNSPFVEPTRHWRFGEDGITNEVVNERRVSAYFMPIAKSKKSDQLDFDTEWTSDRIEPNRFINRVRERVRLWRKAGWPGITPTSRRLLEHWTNPEREKKLFFCQIEALETAIYIGEVVNKKGHQDAWIVNSLREYADDANPGLPRLALKMATGTGKTVVMGMLIAWQALNKLANKQDNRFSDAFLVVSPGITIRDRLRVLLPQSPDNYYRERDLLNGEDIARLTEARIAVTNFHAFLPRDRTKGSRTTKEILAQGGPNPFLETPEQVVNRVCRGLGQRKGIVVLNDEAHHCYRHRIGGEASDFHPETLKGDERREATQREEQARVWLTGLESINAKIGVKSVYDLSATPFFLSGSGYPEGTMFPWVVSDFALIDSIEAGLVKVPRVPVADDAGSPDGPVYRALWAHVKDELPKKGVKAQKLSGPPTLPPQLQGAIHSLYGHYKQSYESWHAQEEDLRTGSTPPVFIVVCNNTSVSKLVFDYVAGWEKELGEDEKAVVSGALPLFSNAEDGHWLSRPRSILVDSAQLETGEGMTLDFKRVAAAEIERFKEEYRARFPGRDADELTDEDLLREVMNTVGKPDRLGSGVRCVVSVSMLTEGWDANTVTHILGVRAFGTQLLCEQVVGRGLRRRSYALNEDGRFEPEYAEVYGVPFSFIPAAGDSKAPAPLPPMTRVRALEDRAGLEIAFPRVRAYRFEVSGQSLGAEFTPQSELALSTADVPSETEVYPVIGESATHTLDDLRSHREQEVVFRLAKNLAERHWPDQPWAFPQLIGIARDWIRKCLVLKDNTFPQMLLLHGPADKAVEKIQLAIVRAAEDERTLLPVLAPYDPVGSTATVDFDTAKPCMPTDPDRCHVSHVVCDTESWEQKMAQVLEEMPEVLAYVKNEGLGFEIPYVHDGRQHSYIPDFIVRVDDGKGAENPLNLIVEVTGQEHEAKKAKTEAAHSLWVPAVNQLGEYGRWAFLEVRDPWAAQEPIRAALGASAGIHG